jgi:transcriptional regulator with PAS, ATPase and Fis domain
VIVHRLSASTPSLQPLTKQICVAASHDVTVLVTGETGTGKTFLARLIHDLSPRKDEPFVVVPCGALQASLIESELFGHVRGAFTGADRDKVGRLEVAGQGTILLDEIDTLELEQQTALLRVVETGEFEPVGSHKTRLCKARLIAASNRDLECAVQEGRFRQDLWYRLNVLPIHLPPLRQRVQDIAPLARSLADHYGGKFKKGRVDISPEAMAALEHFPWPGNIRQLDNVIQQAVLLNRGPRMLQQHLPPQLRDAVPADPICVQATPPPGTVREAVSSTHRNGHTPAGSLQEGLAADERALVQKALQENQHNRSRTAHALGISRVTLYKKMKKYGIPVVCWPPETE